MADHITCRVCGTSFTRLEVRGRKPKHCPWCSRRSLEIITAELNRSWLTCQTCARVFDAKKTDTSFCSQPCRSYWRNFDEASRRQRESSISCRIYWGPCGKCGDPTYRGQRWATRMICEQCHTATLRANWAKRNKAKRKIFECAVCGDEFVSHQSPSLRRLTCEAHRPHVLERNLRDYAKALATIGPTLHPFRQCEWCDHRFRGMAATCSADCGRSLRYAKSSWVNGRPWASTVHIADCDECGSRFVGRSLTTRFCSAACNARASRRARRPQRRADKHHRRLLRQAGDVFTNREIAERDGWRCHLCGRKIPDRPYSAKPDDLTIDHLVPVADGGAHTRANVMAAHNFCNTSRKTGGTVQLLLVG